MNKSGNIIFFDGVCNLCNASVNFIIARDKKKLFRFAALQDDKSKEILQPFGIGEELNSIIYFEDGRIYHQSDAVLRIGMKLGGIWSIAYVLLIIPGFIRNGIYRYIARNRYKWFGRKEHCNIPEPEYQDRFL